MLDAEAAFAGIAGQVELMRRGDASARDLAGLALARIAALDPQLNAFGVVLADRALTAADEADRRRAAGEDGPLLGVPIAVKDEIDIAGHLTSRGTDAFTVPAASDAEVVRRLRAAGAVIVGKTTMPELGLWPFTESVTWGVTRNPWDTGRTPGGSSGGSAAAVAAGIVPAALAADGAGSIRIPAACTGLFGLKPQRGRVPRAPHDRDGSHWIVFGALTRSVLDSGIMLDALTESPGTFTAAAGAEQAPLRVAVSEAFPPGVLGRLAPDVRDALHGTADVLRGLGHTVVERDVDFGPRDTAIILGLLFRGVRDIVAETERPGRLERRSRAFARPGALVPDRMRERLLEAERRLAARVGTLFDEHDVLAHAGHVAARAARRAHGGPRRDRDVPLGVRLGAVQRPVELDRSTCGVGPCRLLRRGPAARRAARRAPRCRGDAAVARGAARGRPPLGGPAPARVLSRRT